MVFRLIGRKRLWSPHHVKEGTDKYAVLLLNHAFDHKGDKAKAVFANIWTKGQLKVAVDGGCNWLHALGLEKPDIICGDFDSVEGGLRESYQSQGSKVVPTPDQDATDFTKAVQIVLDHIAAEPFRPVNYILAIGSIGGRLDHCFSNVNTLYSLLKETLDVPLFLYDVGDYISWVLTNEGEHSIESNPDSKWCSLIPVGEPCTATTTGLKWNLSNDTMNFGGLISTSNEFDKEKKQVTVETNRPILWSMDLP